jgi:hypothetical protein
MVAVPVGAAHPRQPERGTDGDRGVRRGTARGFCLSDRNLVSSTRRRPGAFLIELPCPYRANRRPAETNKEDAMSGLVLLAARRDSLSGGAATAILVGGSAAGRLPFSTTEALGFATGALPRGRAR